ncbi:nuclease-related domain-containing protein [Burkholderia pyrrocinia]|uniref:nuclease-related domain-containing protein n=1 Tax=Burkholderia pyrrocinia TaxID=60550 RepID=UPI002AAFAB1C|nr:nuclease-related domain-containing protein [Burkholderia pyrrocinia]
MTVEIFCRYSNGASNAAERRVLQRVVEILKLNEHSAIVLCDFYCGGQQIDLLIATEITTLVLQVKSYRHAVSGSINSENWLNQETGEPLPNAYTQATDQMLALKDMLRRRTGVDPGFARAVVLFEPGIPIGSSLPSSDFRVQITAPEGLQPLLATPTSERSARVPWNLAHLRSYAVEEKMARLTADSSTAKEQSVRRSFYPSAQAAVPPTPVDMLPHHVIDVPARAVSVTVTSQPPAPLTFCSSRSSTSAAPCRPRHIRRYAIALLATGAGIGWFARPAPKAPPAEIVTSAHSPVTLHHAVESKHHRHHAGYAGAGTQASSPATPTPVVTTSVQPPAIPENDAPLLPCPPGIDRLGCVPSQETLARLSKK